MKKPYYQDDYCTIYHGDARVILPALKADVVITDPIWPGVKETRLQGCERPYELFREAVHAIDAETLRMAFIIGIYCDPKFLDPVDRDIWPFFRAVLLENAVPGYRGRVLNNGDLAYYFGPPPPLQGPSRGPNHMIPGKCTDNANNSQVVAQGHPTPRKIKHMTHVVRWWSNPDETVLDPFMGSGTTARAAKDLKRKFIGIEIEEKFCEIAVRRLKQEVLSYDEK